MLCDLRLVHARSAPRRVSFAPAARCLSRVARRVYINPNNLADTHHDDFIIATRLRSPRVSLVNYARAFVIHEAFGRSD